LTAFAPASGNDRERLILEHVPLLHHIVGRMCLDVHGVVDREDLIGWGMLGLIEAADSWDRARGLRFSTYAFPRIRGAIRDELRRVDFLPRGQRSRVRSVERAVRRLEQELGCAPTLEEIAEYIELPCEEIEELLHAAHVAACLTLAEGPRDEFLELLSGPACDDPAGSAEWIETRDVLADALGRLPSPDREVVTLYFGEELLLKEIGEVLGVSESRVSQIRTRALYLLNRELGRRLTGSEGCHDPGPGKRGRS